MDGPGLSGHRHWYSRGRKGFKEGQVAYLCLLLSLLAVIAAPLRAQTSRELFPNTKDLGHAVVEYEDDAIKVVAAYKYSQQNHDSRWLLIEIGVAAQDDMRIERDDITLVTPDDSVIHVASQRTFAQDRERVRLVRQESGVVQHIGQRVWSYFPVRRAKRFQWFVVTPLEGTVTETFDVDFHRTAWGDLYFASPTGTWVAGTYSLVVQGADKTSAVLPIDLD